MTPEQLRARGYAAKALLSDPTLNEGWDLLIDDLRADWERSWWPARRNRIWAQLRHVRALRSKLAEFAGQARE